ncbi:hypothetical protein [Rheinheimera sp.]|uniref:hypothetical protein n=1 Tax=Rheinheimera sp. TaxID=1869214 RepID=UPI0040473ADF
MSKTKKSPAWLPVALSSLEFFVHSPEYKNEFGHDYVADRCNVNRMTLWRNEIYMKRYYEVREILQEYKPTKSTSGPSYTTDISAELAAAKEKNEQLQNELDALQLRLNDCYQMLEDNGIDPEFVYPTKLKKHREA